MLDKHRHALPVSSKLQLGDLVILRGNIIAVFLCTGARTAESLIVSSDLFNQDLQSCFSRQTHRHNVSLLGVSQKLAIIVQASTVDQSLQILRQLGLLDISAQVVDSSLSYVGVSLHLEGLKLGCVLGFYQNEVLDSHLVGGQGPGLV